jgi:hypothetical protein
MDMLREGHSRVAAAERSHGRRPWFMYSTDEPRRGKRIFRRSAAHFAANFSHGLQPWLNSAAAPRHNLES